MSDEHFSFIASHLLNQDTGLFLRVTTHPFLLLGGQGELPNASVEKWLQQQRSYVQSSLNFTFALSASLQHHRKRLCNQDTEEAKTKARDVMWEVTKVVDEALARCNRETESFADIAEEYGMECVKKSWNEGLHLYQDLFEECQGDLLDSLVLLWASARCYVAAWGFANNRTQFNERPAEDEDGDCLRKEFIPYWTSDEFREFVRDCRVALESVWEIDGEGKLDRVETLWKRALEAEGLFWPCMCLI